MPSIWSKYFGSGVSTAIGVGVGGPAGTVLEPGLRDLLNHAWNLHQSAPLEVYALAAGVAQGQIDRAWAADEATLSGVAGDRFAKLVATFDTGPGVAEAFNLWRRDVIDEAGFRRAVKREGIEQEWIEALVATKQARLSVAEVAAAVQQGHMPNPGILPDVSAAVAVAEGAVAPATPDGQPPSTVPLTQIALDPITEAAAHGVDVDRLRVIANLSGLPPGAAELLALWNRGELDEAGVDAGLREGHLKTKWSGAFKRLRWSVLGAAEYASAHLRGWIDQGEMYAGGALTGHTKSQMDLLYLNRGRPLAPVQAFTAAARGAPGPTGQGYDRGAHPFDEQDFLRALQQSDIRTEYGPTLWGLRFAYPPLFQLVRLAVAGAFPEDRFRQILHYERYEPVDVDHLADYAYRGTGKTVASPWVAKAETQLWTAIHKGYLAGALTDAAADAALNVVVADAADRAFVLELWRNEANVGAAPRAGG